MQSFIEWVGYEFTRTFIRDNRWSIFATGLKNTHRAHLHGGSPPASDLVRSRTLSPCFPLISVAVVYYILVAGLSALVKRLEKRMARSKA